MHLSIIAPADPLTATLGARELESVTAAATRRIILHRPERNTRIMPILASPWLRTALRLIARAQLPALAFLVCSSPMWGQPNYWNLVGTSLSPTDLTYKVGIGTSSPNASLTIGSPFGNSAHSAIFTASAPPALSSTAGSDINLGSFGFWSNNETMLGIHGYRTSAGNSWNTTAVGLSMDVDNTPRAGASLWLNANGNVGIGTTAPITPLHVQGTAQSSIVGTFASNNGNTAQIQSAGIALGVGGSTPWGQIWGTQSFAGTYQHGGLSFWTRNNEVMYQRMTIDYQGNVGIGTTAPCTASNAPANCKLSVAGAIQAKEVVVNTGWSDYVFAPSYRLKPLSEVATFIRANHHLPGIPSEAEVKENGVSLGEMQAKLLAKIEELTLHAIRLEQENRDLQARVARIEGRTPASAPASQGHN